MLTPSLRFILLSPYLCDLIIPTLLLLLTRPPHIPEPSYANIHQEDDTSRDTISDLAVRGVGGVLNPNAAVDDG